VTFVGEYQRSVSGFAIANGDSACGNRSRRFKFGGREGFRLHIADSRNPDSISELSARADTD
jgi:hypothetical protein